MTPHPICLVTGANSGIGKAVVKELARKGAKVILACRNEIKGKQALQEIHKATGNSEVELMLVDLSSMTSIRKFTDEFLMKFHRLDVLIHNAANFDHTLKKSTLTEDGFETIIATNYLGPFLMTRLLLPGLLASAMPRLISIGTKGLDFYPFTLLDLEDLHLKSNKFTTAKAYYNSKLALLMFTVVFSKLFKGKIAANGIRVTNVAIDDERLVNLPWYLKGLYFIKRQFSISPHEMAKTYIDLALSPELNDKTGLYWDENQTIVNFPPQALNEDLQQKLWKLTEDTLDVSFKT